MRSIADPPPRAAVARFEAGFGQRFLLSVDASDEAWLSAFLAFCESEGVVALVGPGEGNLDASVRPKFDCRAEGGPDYRRHSLVPYWLDEARTRLEAPLTTTFWGLLRRQGDWLYPAVERRARLRRLLAKLSLLDRIPLDPQGVSVEDAIRSIDMALDDGLPLLVFTCRLPPAGEQARFDDLCDWWERVFAYLDLRQVRPASAAEVLQAVRP